MVCIDQILTLIVVLNISAICIIAMYVFFNKLLRPIIQIQIFKYLKIMKTVYYYYYLMQIAY